MHKKLYIIGNGFDVHHGIKSQYSYFKEWLMKKTGFQSECDILDFYERNKNVEYSTNYKGLEEYDEKSFATMFFNLIEDACEHYNCNGMKDWADFEKSLGLFRWEQAIDTSILEIYDKTNPDDLRNIIYEIEDQAINLSESCHLLKMLFSEWILSEIEPSIENLKIQCGTYLPLYKNSFFLNFNYTSTLETLYAISDVLHIHGYSKEHNELIVGHGLDMPEFDDYFDEKYGVYSYSYFEKIFKNYKKNVDSIIEKNKYFFRKLKDVDEIYIYGKSISDDDVDLPYFREVINCLNKPVTIYVHVYGNTSDEIDKKFNEIKKVINDLSHSKIKQVNLWNIYSFKEI